MQRVVQILAQETLPGALLQQLITHLPGYEFPKTMEYSPEAEAVLFDEVLAELELRAPEPAFIDVWLDAAGGVTYAYVTEIEDD